MSTPVRPFGKSPWSVTKLPSPAAGTPAAGLTPMMVAAPTTMTASTATTLISDSQNSVSPKTREEIALIVNSAAPKTRHHTHTGTPGNQRFMRIPDAVSSLPRATAQHIQYSQAVVNPYAAPRLRVA